MHPFTFLRMLIVAFGAENRVNARHKNDDFNCANVFL